MSGRSGERFTNRKRRIGKIISKYGEKAIEWKRDLLTEKGEPENN